MPGVVPESRDVRLRDHLHGITGVQMKRNFARARLVSTGPGVCRALLDVVLPQTRSNSGIRVRKDILKTKEKSERQYTRVSLRTKEIIRRVKITVDGFRMHYQGDQRDR